MMKKLLVIAALTSGLVLSACNTVRGAAEDVESTTDCADGVDNNC
jgi:predicted small secreted protein